MELEEMKALWAEMSVKVEHQEKLTDALIIKMARVNYNNKLSKILIPEAAGSLVCLAALLYILFNFQRLNIIYLQVSAVAAIMVLVVLPVLSIRAICKMRGIQIAASTYKELISAYATAKVRFIRVQKASFYLSAVLLLVMLPVMGKLIGGKDMFKATSLWYWYTIGFSFFYLLAQWVFKNYTRTANDAENILKELEG